MSKRLFFLAVLGVVLISGMPFSWANAQRGSDEPSGCIPLDAIVLLDQSDSMGTQDPDADRIDAVGNLIDVLYENAAIRCPGVIHRLGVIGFGSEAEVIVGFDDELSLIQVEDITDNWEAKRDALKGEIRTASLGDTSLRDAADLANSMFETPFPASAVQRARTLIIISDGTPCTQLARDRYLANEIVQLPFTDASRGPCQNPGWITHYLLGDENDGATFDSYNTEATYRDAGFDFPNGFANYLDTSGLGVNTSVNVLLFNTAPEYINDSINLAWTNVTSAKQGQYFEPNYFFRENLGRLDRRLIAVTLDNIVSELIGVERNNITFNADADTCVGAFFLEPYASSTTIISTTRPSPEQRVSITDPNGDELPAQNQPFGISSVQYSAGRSVERFIVINPLPGRWQITDPTGDCENVVATFETITLNVNVLAPTAVVPNVQSPYFTTSNADYISIILTDSVGERFEENAAYPLNICGRINSNNPEANALISQPCVLEFAAAEEGVWRSTTPVPAPRQGTYTVQLTATVDSVINPGSDLQIFSTSASYQTAPPITLQLRVSAPTPGLIVPLNQIDPQTGSLTDAPFDVQAEFVDGNGNAVSLTQIFPTGAGDNVAATLYRNTDRLRQVTLSPSDTNNATLTGTFATENGLPDLAGDYRVEFALTPGAINAYNDDNYVFGTMMTSVEFSRQQLDGVRLILLAPQPTDTFMLNRIESGVALGEPVAVSAQLIDQSCLVARAQNPDAACSGLDAAEVFTTDATQLVSATLRNDDGQVGNPITLLPSTSNIGIFEGSFPSMGEAIGREGEYTVELNFGINQSTPEFVTNADNSPRYTYLSPATESVTFYRTEQRGVRPIIVSLAGNTPSDETDPTRFLVNTLTNEGEQRAEGIPVTAGFIDLSETLYTGNEVDTFFPVSAQMTAHLVSASGSEETTVLTRDENGRFSGLLRADADSVLSEGRYQVYISIPDFEDENATSRYVLVDNDSDRRMLETFQTFGVRLTVVNVGGVGITPDTEQPITFNLYNSIIDAFNVKITPVTFEMTITNTVDNALLLWQDIVIDASTEDAAETLEATAEATAAPSTVDMSVLLSDLVVVYAQPSNGGDRLAASNVRQEQLPDGRVVIRGEIVGIDDTDEYILLYGLNTDVVNTVRYRNYTDASDIAQRGTVRLTREIDGLFYDPAFWQVIKPILGILALLYLVWFLIINVGPLSMRGTLDIWYTPINLGAMPIPIGVNDPRVTDKVRLGRIKLLRSGVRGRNTKVRVSRTQARTVAPVIPLTPAPGGASPVNRSSTMKGKRAYRLVAPEGGTLIIEQGENRQNNQPLGARHSG